MNRPAPPRSIAALGLLLMCATTTLQALCFKPAEPPALDADMDSASFRRAHHDTQTYLQQAHDYLKCLEQERADASRVADDGENNKRVKEHNATVADIRKVSARWEEQERQFKAQLSAP